MPTTAPPSIGGRLKRAREDRQLSIEETAWRTRMRPDVLRAIEREQFGALEHAGFVRGTLASYARFLGLESRDIVRDYQRRYGRIPSPVEEVKAQGKRATKPPRPKWMAAAVASAAVLLVAGVLGLVGGQDEQLAGVDAQGPRLSAPHAASRSGAPRVALTIAASGASELRVRADGVEIFDGVIADGETKQFSARDGIEIFVANAGGVRLSLNGTDLGTPGEKGESFRGRYGPDGPIPG